MSGVKNVSRGPVDLSTGRILAPGESAEDVEITEHEQVLIEAGTLLAFDSAGRKRPVSTTTPKED